MYTKEQLSDLVLSASELCCAIQNLKESGFTPEKNVLSAMRTLEPLINMYLQDVVANSDNAKLIF